MNKIKETKHQCNRLFVCYILLSITKWKKIKFYVKIVKMCLF